MTPSAAIIDAYSAPITPAPTTVIVRGRRSSLSIPSESITVRSSKETSVGRAGTVPTAITMRSAVQALAPSSPCTVTEWGPEKDAKP